MLTNELITLFARDLLKLETEIEAYTTEEGIWKTAPGIANSAGNLTLHLIGNLNHFIGATLGNTGYVRNRPAEFARQNLPRAELIQSLEDTQTVVRKVLSQLSEKELDADFPLQVLQEVTSTRFFLLHLSTHLAYHLGQVNYHRRMLDTSGNV